MEGLSGDSVRGEVVYGVSPEHEAGSALCQQDLDAALVARAGFPHVQDYYGDAGVFELPVFVRGGFCVEVGEGTADKDLKTNKRYSI